ncbi:MAG: 50S ribosomal protein L25 [Aminivibrio sp.]|jgi:large subunit ribosomal protein L25|nr:50S ribosomal protein L25 [Synergistaceae bacterium]
MSEILKVVLEAREEKGKQACKKLRPAGYTPCVLYGPGYRETVPGKVKTSAIAKVAASGRWETTTMMMTLPNGAEEMAIMREIQKDPITDKILHIDFLQLVKGHRITVNVPVELVGRDECAGVKLGGIIDHLYREISIEVLPSQIPNSIEVDVSALGLGEQIQVKDLPVPEGAQMLTSEDEVVVAVIIPRGVSEEEEAGEAGDAEVEVVAKGKAKDEGEE